MPNSFVVRVVNLSSIFGAPTYLVVMSPSRAGSSRSSSWSIFGSARDLFLSARKFPYVGSKIGKILGFPVSLNISKHY